jgi:hypothetical protein
VKSTACATYVSLAVQEAYIFDSVRGGLYDGMGFGIYFGDAGEVSFGELSGGEGTTVQTICYV